VPEHHTFNILEQRYEKGSCANYKDVIVPENVKKEDEFVWCRCCKGKKALRVRLWGRGTTCQALAVNTMRNHEENMKFIDSSHRNLDYNLDRL